MKKLKSLIFIVTIIFIFSTITAFSTTVYAEDNRIEVSIIEGESNDIDLIPVYGGNLIQPTIDMVTGYPAYFYTEGGFWQKKNGDNWETIDKNEKFRAGTWRYSCKIFIDTNPSYNDGIQDGTTHRLAENITISVNGNKWTADTSTINTDEFYSYTRVYSNEYEIQEPEIMYVYDSDDLNIGTNKATIPIQEFSIVNCVEGGTKPYKFSKKSGPNWVNVSNNGIISGTPKAAGTNEDLVIQISDSSAETQVKTLTISVANTELAPSQRETISEIIATSENIDSIPNLNVMLGQPQINVTNNKPVYFNTNNVIWQKREIDKQDWNDKQPPEKFTVGIWRYSCTIYVENNEEYFENAGSTHKLSDKTKVIVNGEEWKIGNVQIGSDYSIATVYSKEYYITEPGTFIVSFNTNEGSFIESKIVEAGAKVSKPKDPTRRGYVFDGWYADKQLKNVFNFNTSTISAHTVIYAKWHKHSLVCIAGKAATCTATGNITYYKCTTCNKLYKDKNATQEIKMENNILPIIAHKLKDVVVSKEKTKATLEKNGKIIRHIETKCTSCGKVFGTKTTTEKVYYAKTIKLSKKTFKYNKKVQKPTLIIKDSKGKVIDESCYTLKYSNKNSKKVGEYTVTVTFKNKYKGTKLLKYRIKPQGTTIKKLKPSSKQFKVIWKKNTEQTTGYQIQYATNKKFTKNSNKEFIEDNKKTSRKYKNLKENKKYYVRIRTYKTIKGKKIYSSWSEAKIVNTKK